MSRSKAKKNSIFQMPQCFPSEQIMLVYYPLERSAENLDFWVISRKKEDKAPETSKKAPGGQKNVPKCNKMMQN